MPLNEEPEEVTLPSFHFIHVKKIGPFQETAPNAWKELHANLPSIIEKWGQPHVFCSLYQTKPEMVYMAGVAVKKDEEEFGNDSLPTGMEYLHFAGGKYVQFTLTGSFDQLPTACGRVFEIAQERGIVSDPAVEGNGRYFLENYLKDPSTTPVEELITHIGIPIA